MRRLLEPLARCQPVATTRTAGMLIPRRAIVTTDGSVPGELASAAFAVAAKLLRDDGMPLRDEWLVRHTRFARLKRTVLWLPEREAGP